MELTVPNENKSSRDDYEQLQNGSHEAVCVDVIYPVVKQFEKEKPRNCVIFVFEINEQRKRTDGETDESRYQVWSDSFTITLHSMGKLRPFLEQWLGREMEEKEKLTLDQLHNKSAKITTSLKKKKRKPDEKYVSIAAILPWEGEFETDEAYERKDPVDYSDIKPTRTDDGEVPF
jgi:hypothetical protein